jgi:hypothetical protein
MKSHALERATVAELEAGQEWSIAVERRSGGVSLILHHPQRDGMEVTIELTESGPVVRAKAIALEIVADRVTTRCERFEVEATGELRLSGRTITHHASEAVHCEGASVDLVANAGNLRLRANDDCQLLAEQILLNCERPPPMPTWVPSGPRPPQALPRQDEAGDPTLLARFART